MRMSKQIVNVEFQLQTGEFTSSSSPPQSSKCASTSSKSSGDKYILRLIRIAKNSPQFLGCATRGRTTWANCKSQSWTTCPTSTGSFLSSQSLLCPQCLVSTTCGACARTRKNHRKSWTQPFCLLEYFCSLLFSPSALSCHTSLARPSGEYILSYHNPNKTSFFLSLIRAFVKKRLASFPKMWSETVKEWKKKNGVQVHPTNSAREDG